MTIKSHRERPDLRPGEYVLESLEYAPVANSRIPDPVRKTVLLRDGTVCRFCGFDSSAARSARDAPRPKLRIDYIEPLESGGKDEDENIAVICSSCYKSRQKTLRRGHSARELIALIRTAPPAVQREVYFALKSSFERRRQILSDPQG
jgi:hypothetical protein